MTWILGQSLINGLLMGGVYALISTGITIIVGVMNMVNFAMGEFIMFGMYITWLGSMIFSGNAYQQLIFVVIAMALMGYICFKLTLSKIIGKGSTAYILMTVGLSFFLQNLAQIIFGPNYRTIPSDMNNISIPVGIFNVSLPRLIAFVVAIILIVAISTLMSKTSLGRKMRATSEKPQVAEILGIDTKKIFTVAFVLGLVLAGVAGLLVTPIYSINPIAGNIFKTTALMIVVLGGMGSIKGAFICGMFVGVVEALVATFISPDLGPAAVFAFFLLVVYFKPQGLYGRKERIA